MGDPMYDYAPEQPGYGVSAAAREGGQIPREIDRQLQAIDTLHAATGPPVHGGRTGGFGTAKRG